MALIKCPRCGQTVLSVASTCPKCSFLFLEAPRAESAAGALVDCRRCSKRIPPESASCPYCAYPIRRMQILMRWGIGAGLAAVALVAVLITLGRRAAPGDAVALSGAPPPELPAGPAQTTDPTPPSDRQPAAPVVTDTGFRAAPLAAAPPRAAPARTPSPESERTAPDTVRDPRRPPASPAGSATRETRWVLDWVNVREGRGVENAVVTVLRPGVEVQVTDQRGGWWAVYVGGTFVGYASGVLFSAEPPAGPTT